MLIVLEKDESNMKTLENLDILYINYAMNRGTYIEEAKESVKRLLSKKPNDERYLEVQRRLFGN